MFPEGRPPKRGKRAQKDARYNEASVPSSFGPLCRAAEPCCLGFRFRGSFGARRGREGGGKKVEGGFDKFAVPPPLLARSLNLLSAAKAKGGKRGKPR